MKRLVIGVVALVISLVPPALARCEIAASELRQFEKGKTTLDQVVGRLGQPAATDVAAEGLKGIAYAPAGLTFKPGAVLALFGTLDGLFMPGAPVQNVASGHGAITAFVFDRTGRLLYYRQVSDSAAPVTSEDGAAEMPNIRPTLPPDRIETAVPADGKPHLGVQVVPIGDFDEGHRRDFAAAKFDGVVVVNVIPGSVAERAGLRQGDYLYVLDGVMITSFADAARAMAAIKTGDTVLARAKRIDETSHLARETVFTLRF